MFHVEHFNQGRLRGQLSEGQKFPVGSNNRSIPKEQMIGRSMFLLSVVSICIKHKEHHEASKSLKVLCSL